MSVKHMHVFLTGPPGIGKTTLVKKVVKLLQEFHAVTASGFYTEELRDNRTRIGFDVVSFEDSQKLENILCL